MNELKTNVKGKAGGQSQACCRKTGTSRGQCKKVKQLQNKIKKIEEDIEVLEHKKAESDKKINVPGFYESSDTTAFFNEYNQLKSKLEGKFKQWEELSAQLNTL